MTSANKQLLVATNNSGKLTELRQFLGDMRLDLVNLSNFPAVAEIEETGSTFDANARLKAAGYALRTGLNALADDSGLEVAALDNRPGVLSARYGGKDTSFEEKMAKLLSEMDKIGNSDRRARFVCSMAIADPSGKILFTSEGICEGTTAPAPRGNGGFGYDPLFIPDGFDQTFGELSDAVKQRISHRYRAFEQIIPFLGDFIAV